MQLDLGETEKVETYIKEASQNEDGPQPVETMARIVAHVMHKIPGSRTVAKRFEGNDKKSGLFSDLGLLAYSLIVRNENVLLEATDDAVKDFFDKKKTGSFPDPHLGDVNPMVVKNNHMEA